MKEWKPSEYYRSEEYQGPLAEEVKIDTYDPCPSFITWYIPATNPVPDDGQKGRTPGEIRHGDEQVYLGNGKYKVIPR
jgi:hypothetical protein